MDCPACKRPAPGDAVFCPHCGLGLAGASACPACETVLAPWERVCPGCGLSRATSAPNAPPAERGTSGRLAALRSTLASRWKASAEHDVQPSHTGPAEYGSDTRLPILAGVTAALLACAAAFYLMRGQDAPAPAVMEASHAAPDSVAAPMPTPAAGPAPTSAPTFAPAHAPALAAAAPVPAAQPPAPEPTAQESSSAGRPAPRRTATSAAAPCKKPPVQAQRAVASPERKAAPPREKKAPTKVAAADRPTARARASSSTQKASAGGWHAALKARLAVCERKSLLEWVVCREKARWKYCSPERWDKVPECRLNARPGRENALFSRSGS